MCGALFGAGACAFPSGYAALPDRYKEEMTVVSVHMPDNQRWSVRRIAALVLTAHALDRRTLLIRDPDGELADYSVIRLVWPRQWLVPAWGHITQVPGQPGLLAHAAEALLMEQRKVQVHKKLRLTALAQLGQNKWVA